MRKVAEILGLKVFQAFKYKEQFLINGWEVPMKKGGRVLFFGEMCNVNLCTIKCKESKAMRVVIKVRTGCLLESSF